MSDDDDRVSAHTTDDAVLDAFKQVLGLAEVSRDVPFAALGGDSMRAVRVLSRIWRELGVELPVHALRDNTTASELAAAIRDRAGSS